MRQKIRLPSPALHQTALVTFLLIVLLSFGNFNPMFVGGSLVDAGAPESSPQQALVLGLWLVILLLSCVPEARRHQLDANKLVLPAMLIAYASLSCLWSEEWAASYPKAIALCVGSLAAFRLATLITVAEMVGHLRLGLLTLVTASVIVCVALPGVARAHIGIATTMLEHEGLWMGLFLQKQILGLAAAFLLYLSLARLLREGVHGRHTLLDLFACAESVLALIESGSRGALVVVCLLVVILMLARTHRQINSVMSWIIVLHLLLGVGQLLFFAYTDYVYIPFGDTAVDFTKRTYIWAYAAHYWRASPLFGYGLNGFWTNPTIRGQYSFIYKWVLENFHSGYMGIFVETGVVGYTLFSATTILMHSDLRLRLAKDRGRSAELEICLGLILLIYTINLEETFFLRSTNIVQAVFSFLLAKLLISRTQPRPQLVRQTLRPLTGAEPAQAQIANAYSVDSMVTESGGALTTG